MKKLWEWRWETQRKAKIDCENDDEKHKEIVRMMMVDPHFRFSCDRPPAKSAPFSPFYLLLLSLWLISDDEESDDFEKVCEEVIEVLSISLMSER